MSLSRNWRIAIAVAACALAATLVLGSGAGEETTPDAADSHRSTAAPQDATSDVPPTNDPPAAQDQAALDDQLRQAAWAGDVATAEQLIGQGADVNAQDSTQQSAFLIASSEGPLDLLRLTMAHGADLTLHDSYDGTALIRAAERGLYSISGDLVRAGIDKAHVNNIGYQALHEAVWFGDDSKIQDVTTVRVLIAAGAPLDTPSAHEQLTPVAMASQKGYQSMENALEAAADSNVSDPNAALLSAAHSGDADMVAAALRAGADIETRDAHQRTALLRAVSADNVDVARVLVAMGADPNALDDRHDTPWLVTGVTGSVAMLEELLPGTPDFTEVNRFGGTSVIPASERGHAAYVARVVQLPIDVNHVNDLGWTALLEAVVYGDGGAPYQQIVTTLIDAGADPNLPDATGKTAKQHAGDRGQSEVVAIIDQHD